MSRDNVKLLLKPTIDAFCEGILDENERNRLVEHVLDRTYRVAGYDVTICPINYNTLHEAGKRIYGGEGNCH